MQVRPRAGVLGESLDIYGTARNAFLPPLQTDHDRGLPLAERARVVVVLAACCQASGPAAGPVPSQAKSLKAKGHLSPWVRARGKRALRVVTPSGSPAIHSTDLCSAHRVRSHFLKEYCRS